MERCNHEDFFFDVPNNLFAIQVSDSFDTSQAMYLGELFKNIAKVGTAKMYSFNVTLQELVGKKDWFTRYDEVKTIIMPCLVILGEGYRYDNSSDDQYALNLFKMFRESRNPAIYMGNNVFGHIHRKADALEEKSMVTPVILNNQVYYRFTEHSLYGWTYGRSLILMFNPFIPILRQNELYQSPHLREGFVGIHKDAYAQYKKEIVNRINMYSLTLIKQIEYVRAQQANGVMCAGIELFLHSGYGLFIGTKEDYANYQKYKVLPFKFMENGSIARKTLAELQAEKNAKDVFNKRYAIAESRLAVFEELLNHTMWKGWTALSLGGRDTFEDDYEKDNSHYKVWINSNVRHLRSGWFTESDLLDLINNEGRIPTTNGLCRYWGGQIEKLSKKTYKVTDICGPSIHDDSAEYKAKVKTPEGKVHTYNVDSLKKLAYKLGYKEQKFSKSDIEKAIKHGMAKNKCIKILDSKQ